MGFGRASRPQFVTCPSTETVLLDDGTLLLLPVAGREQLQVDAPWGRLVHDVIVGGCSVDECGSEHEVEVLHATVRHLAARGVLVQAERVAATEVARYDRQVRWFAQEGLDGPRAQRTLTTTRVLILGVGGFGAAMAELLCRAGVGRLDLVDADRVGAENIPRQLLYSDRDVDTRKVFAAAARLEQLAPGIDVRAHARQITSGADVSQLVRLARPDLVICAADHPPMAIKAWVDEGAFAQGVPVMHGGSRPPHVFVGPLLIPGETGCYECFYASRVAPGAEELEALVRIKRDAMPPSLPAVGWADVAAASLASGHVISHLIGAHEPAIAGRELAIDLRTFEHSWMEALPDRGCVRCDRCAA